MLKSDFLITFYRQKEKKLGERLGEKLGEKLNKNEEKVFDLISKNNHITIPELAKRIKITTTAIENNIAKLKQKGLLKRVGPDKGGYWEVSSR